MTLLKTAPFAHGPIVEMGDGIPHFLDTWQSVKVVVARMGKCVANGRVHSQLGECSLFQCLRGEQLDKCEDQVSGVDLLGTQHAGPLIC